MGKHTERHPPRRPNASERKPRQVLVGAEDIDSFRRVQLPRFRRQPDGTYVREYSNAPLERESVFNNAVSFFPALGVPLKDVQCGDFSSRKEVPEAFLACTNLKELADAVRQVFKERKAKGENVVKGISWKVTLTPEQYAVMEGKRDREIER